MRWFFCLFLFSCSIKKQPTPQHTILTRTAEYQQEIDDLIAEDADNKHWARVYLAEIDAAMLHDDIHTYVFFVGEFEKIPLEIVPEHLRDEPGYVYPVSDLELHFRMRWFEQAIIMYKHQMQMNK
jgi:hypothetical protein